MHRRVAMFSIGGQYEGSLKYLEGLREAVHDVGGELPDEFVYFGSTYPELQETEIAKALERILLRPDRPTAIMATFDNVAEVIYLLLGHMKYEVPKDISLVSFGGRHRGGAIARQLSAVCIDGDKIGRQACELLHQMHSGLRPLNDTEEVLMPVEWYPGNTLGDVLT